MANVWQNILASDALCNHLRTPNNPCLSMYCRIYCFYRIFSKIMTMLQKPFIYVAELFCCKKNLPKYQAVRRVSDVLTCSYALQSCMKDMGYQRKFCALVVALLVYVEWMYPCLRTKTTILKMTDTWQFSKCWIMYVHRIIRMQLVYILISPEFWLFFLA